MITLSMPRQDPRLVLAPIPSNLVFSQASLKPDEVHRPDRTDGVVQNVEKRLIGKFIQSLPAHETVTRLDLEKISRDPDKHEYFAKLLYYYYKDYATELINRITYNNLTLSPEGTELEVALLEQHILYTVDKHTFNLRLLLPLHSKLGLDSRRPENSTTSFYPFKTTLQSAFNCDSDITYVDSTSTEQPNNILRIGLGESITFLEYRLPFQAVIQLSELLSDYTTHLRYGSRDYFDTLATSIPKEDSYHHLSPILGILAKIQLNHFIILGPALFMEEFGELGNKHFVNSRLDPDSIFGSEVLYSTLQTALRAIGFQRKFNEISILENCDIERNFCNSTTLSLAHLSMNPETFTKFSVTNSDGIELKYDIGKVQVNYAGKKASVMLVYDHQKSRFTAHAVGASSVESIISFFNNSANHDSPLQITSSTSSNVICALAEIARRAERDTTDTSKASGIEKLKLDLGSLTVKKRRCDIDKHVSFAVSWKNSTVNINVNLPANTYTFQ